jgi:antitoxin PrlF
MTAAAGTPIEAIKVSDDTWLLSGHCAVNPHPPAPRAFEHLGGGTGLKPDGKALGDTIRVGWTLPMLGIAAITIEIIDPGTSTTLFTGAVDPAATFWQSEHDAFKGWSRLRARVTVTDIDGRISQKVSEPFYGMGKPQGATTQALYYKVTNDSFQSLPLLLGDISPQSGQNAFRITAQVKNPSSLNDWWSSPTLPEVDVLTVPFGEHRPAGPLQARYVLENEFGRTVSNFTITVACKGQLTIPRQLRDAQGLAAGARLQASIDRHGRLVLVPSKYEPEDLFKDRPKVARVMSLDDMDRAIAQAVGGEDVPMQ